MEHPGVTPHDGKPFDFRAVQTDTMMSFRFFDHSGCEEAFQFTRNGTQIDSDFAALAECFEELEASRSGDPLSAVNEVRLYMFVCAQR